MRKIISIILSFGLLFQQSGLVYAVGELNLANYLSQAKSAIVQPDQFRPAQLRYISYDIKSNDFKLLLDKGDPKLSNSLNFSTPKLNDATQELFNYFLIGLALPNDTFWVNLRPDAPENIIDPILEKTNIGKIFLEADLQLKKDTASFTSPQNPEGKAYWDKLYKKAGELFGTENITIPTITRPWIVPNEVIVRETEDSAYIYKATLKVMLEADYLADQKTEKPKNGKTEGYGFSDPRLKELNEYSSQIIRETIIPKLTKEINSSKRYAQLRQVYYSLVLARWFKQKYSSLGSISAPVRQSPSASANSYLSLIDSGNLANLASPEPCDKQAYFQAYQKSFKDGEYNLKETVATPFGQNIRSYISGGIFVDYNPAGIKVNSSPVTNILTEQPPATTASPLTIEQEVRSFFESLPANYPQGKEEKPSWDEKMSLLENIEKVKEYLAVGIGIYSKLAQSFLMNSDLLMNAEIDELLESGALPKSKGAQEYFSFIDGRNKFQEYWNNAFDLEYKIKRGKKPAAVSSLDINKAIVDFRFNFKSSRELAELKVDPNLAREVKEELPEYYTEVDGILKRMEEDIKSEYPLKFILGQNISSLNKAYGGFINKTKKMFESVPPPIFNFKSNLGRLLETFNSALTAALPLTPRETIELARKELAATNMIFQHYRRIYILDLGDRIEDADPFSKEDVIKKLNNEILALQKLIEESKKYGNRIDAVVAFEALRISIFFKELIKELKNSSNQSAETRNNEVEKSDSPVTVEQEKLINEIMVATSGRKLKSVPEEILYRIESIIKEIADVKVKIKAEDMAKPIKDLIELEKLNSLYWLAFITLLEKYSGVELLEDGEDIEIKLGESVNKIVEDLQGRMSKENGGEFKGLLKLICRIEVDDLLKKVPRDVSMGKINESIKKDKVGDAAFELGQIFLTLKDHKNANACNLIQNAWKSVTAGSPVMTKEKFLSKINLIQEEVLKSFGKGNNDYYYEGRVYENDTYVISKVWRRTEKRSSEKINFRRIDGGNTIEIDVNSLWPELFHFYIMRAIDTILPGIEYPVAQNVIRIKYDDYKNLTPEVISKFKNRDSYAVIHSASNMILPKVEIKVMRNAIKEVLKIILMDANINTDINKEFRQIDELLTMLRVVTARTRDSDLYILNNVFERLKEFRFKDGKHIYDDIKVISVAKAIQDVFAAYCRDIVLKLQDDSLLGRTQKNDLRSIEVNKITVDNAGEIIRIIDWFLEKVKEGERATSIYQNYKDNLLFIQEVTSPRAAGSPLTETIDRIYKQLKFQTTGVEFMHSVLKRITDEDMETLFNQAMASDNILDSASNDFIKLKVIFELVAEKHDSKYKGIAKSAANLMIKTGAHINMRYFISQVFADYLDSFISGKIKKDESSKFRIVAEGAGIRYYDLNALLKEYPGNDAFRVIEKHHIKYDNIFTKVKYLNLVTGANFYDCMSVLENLFPQTVDKIRFDGLPPAGMINTISENLLKVILLKKEGDPLSLKGSRYKNIKTLFLLVQSSDIYKYASFYAKMNDQDFINMSELKAVIMGGIAKYIDEFIKYSNNDSTKYRMIFRDIPGPEGKNIDKNIYDLSELMNLAKTQGKDHIYDILKFIKECTSSPLLTVVINSKDIVNELKRGGIDLTDRMLKIKLERVGSFALSSLALPEITNVEALDLDKEYERIQAMASVSIRPSDTRILEFAAACYYRGEFDQRLAQVSSCIKAAHLADEISGRDSSEALRLATMLPDALYGG